MALQTVLKLMLEAMIATKASFGPTSGTDTWSRCRLFLGSFSQDSSPWNMFTSSLCVVTASIDSGSGSPSKVFGFGLAIHDGFTDVLHFPRHGYLLLLLI